MLINYAVVFVTGAVTLSLELLASRIMTPYFGVSLFIWSGILSITLLALSAGYYLGGRLSKRFDDVQTRNHLFYLMPGVSSIGIACSCLLYPASFPVLAQFHHVAGAFIASIMLLFIPLVALSSMSPLLISISSSAEGKHAKGDSGAGYVFFLSTIGSVLGVLVTAFLFIPNSTNFVSTLCIGFFVALIPFAYSCRSLYNQKNSLARLYVRLTLLAVLLSFLICLSYFYQGAGDSTIYVKPVFIVLLFCTGLFIFLVRTNCRLLLFVFRLSTMSILFCLGGLFFSSDYLGKHGEILHNGQTWKILGEYTSFFGNVKVLEFQKKSKVLLREGTKVLQSFRKVYSHDGLIQNMTDEEDKSQLLYTYALEALSKGFRPHAESILILGLGAGIIPKRLATEGTTVDVVEIDPTSITVATEHFGFDASSVNIFLEDGRIFVKNCANKYDSIIVDMFHGDGTPDYLQTKEFFHDLQGCIKSDGVVVFNSFFNSNFSESLFNMIKTVQQEFSYIQTYYSDKNKRNTFTNAYIVAMNAGEQKLSPVRFDIPVGLAQLLVETLSAPKVLDSRLLSDARIITDEHNFSTHANAKIFVAYRQNILSQLPPVYLVN